MLQQTQAPATAGGITGDNTAPRHTRLSSAGGGNLLVAGLLRTMSEGDLRALFEPFGTVIRAIVMLDPVTAQSRGFGFVLMETSEAAEAARSALHGTTCGPNRLNVRKSYHDGRVVESNAVFVRNIAASATLEEVANRFAEVGPVRSVVFTPAVSHSREPIDKGSPVDVHAQAAYIEYDTIEEARTAVSLFHLQNFWPKDHAQPGGSSAAASSPMLVKFAERYSERKQRQQEAAAARVPQGPSSSRAAKPHVPPSSFQSMRSDTTTTGNVMSATHQPLPVPLSSTLVPTPTPVHVSYVPGFMDQLVVVNGPQPSSAPMSSFPGPPVFSPAVYPPTSLPFIMPSGPPPPMPFAPTHPGLPLQPYLQHQYFSQQAPPFYHHHHP